jgi:hypothetical protein
MIDTKTPNRLRYAQLQVIEVRHQKKVLKYKIWKEKVDHRTVVVDAKQSETGIAIGNKKRHKPGRNHPQTPPLR